MSVVLCLEFSCFDHVFREGMVGLKGAGTDPSGSASSVEASVGRLALCDSMDRCGNAS